MVSYPNTSPYATTPVSVAGLGFFNIRPVAASPDDPSYTLEPRYTYRPDLLSFDLYGTPKLWWVFMQRNMDVISDPVWDFVPGLTIKIPLRDELFKILGM